MTQRELLSETEEYWHRIYAGLAMQGMIVLPPKYDQTLVAKMALLMADAMTLAYKERK